MAASTVGINSSEDPSGDGNKAKKANVLEKDVTIDKAPAIVQNYQREEVSRGAVRGFFMPFIFQRASNFHFLRATLFLFVAKGIGIASPFILKRIVNSLTTAASAGGAALAAFSLKRTILDVGLWGLSRVLASVFLCYQMNACTAGIQSGIRRVAAASFDHQLELDLDYHKKGSKNTVFEINRALRSLDQGLRFFLGFFSQMALEFVFLCCALQFKCGSRYFLNMIATFAAYAWYTNSFSERRIKEIREKKQIDKR